MRCVIVTLAKMVEPAARESIRKLRQCCSYIIHGAQPRCLARSVILFFHVCLARVAFRRSMLKYGNGTHLCELPALDVCYILY